MDNLIYFFVFLFGLAWGSFMNVIVYRLNTDQSPWRGRSFCPKCKKPIFWYDNIPLFSFLYLRGQCRRCHSPISWQYPLVELGNGLVWLLIADGLGFSLPLVLIFWLLVAWLMLGILVSDLLYQTIPDELSLGLGLLGLTAVLLNQDWGALVAGLGGCALFYFLHLVTRKKGMGMGDVKLVLGLGFLLGAVKSLVGLYIAFITGALVGVILILVGKKKFGQKIAFGPFLILGALGAFFWSGKLIDWWLSLFNW